MKPKKTVLFSYQLLTNVGCEIIVRGSIAFLTRAFPEHDLDFLVSSYDTKRDSVILADLPNVRVVPMIGWKRYARGFLTKTGLDRRFWTPRFATRHFREADLFVSVGGDIYTMSGNALPRDWLGYEQFATRHGIPAIMFGANMEGFEALGTADREWLIDHLKRFRLIAVRDNATAAYLTRYGVSGNTLNFPDPVFMLRQGCTFGARPIRSIGLNASPLLLRKFGYAILDRLVGIVTGLANRNYHVTLIPHVFSSDGDPSLDDRIVLRRLHSALPPAVQSKVNLFDGSMSLASMTRAIEKVDLFVGARMHSCLNAVTLGKPTYFLAYSRKAQTITEWLKEGPFAPVRDRIGAGTADNVTLDAILGLAAAHDRVAPNGPVSIDFERFVSASPIWGRLARSNIFGDR